VVLAQSEDSAIAQGMPRAAAEITREAGVFALRDMAAAISASLRPASIP